MEMINEAELAWAHKDATSTTHSDFGDGSLFAAAAKRGFGREPSLRDREYCRCLAQVYAALANYPEAQDTHFVAVGSS